MKKKLEIMEREYEPYDSEDELDLMELLDILLREKKSILITFLVVAFISFGGALWERDRGLKGSEIIRVDIEKLKGFKEGDLLPLNVVDRVYKSQNIEKNTGLTLDKFKEKFQITPIIPKAIEDQKEFLSKKGEVLEYTPKNYKIDLRVGTVEESLNILNDYYGQLKNYYREKYLNQYTFKTISLDILKDRSYDYLDYITMVENRKESLEDILRERVNKKLNYASYGYGYRELEVALDNLEKLNISELRNFLEATNIVRDPGEFQNQYKSRREKLLIDINEKREQGENYLNLLKAYDKKDREETIPKGIKIEENSGEGSSYYVDILKEYLNSQIQMEKLKNELSILDRTNNNLRLGNKEEIEGINKQLKIIIEKYNKIVQEANRLEYKESYIETGALIKLASPAVIISNSKAKLVLGIGMIMGVFLGIGMAFIKNFLGDFKKTRGIMTIVGIFFLVGVKGYSQDLLVTYTHSLVEKGLNPDETPFNPKKNIKEKFLGEYLKIDKKYLDEVNISPIIPEGIEKTVENQLNGGEDYIYVPSQYRIKVVVKNIEEREKIEKALLEQYPKYYTDSFLREIKSNGTIEYSKEYKSYRKILEAFSNMIDGIHREVGNRIRSNKSKDIVYEYKNIDLELYKLKNVNYRNINDYINSNYFVDNSSGERILLRGKIDRLENQLKEIKGRMVLYKKSLDNYRAPERRVKILENGDISMDLSGNQLKESQYINITKDYVRELNDKILLENEIQRAKELFKNMREPNEIERKKIEEDINRVQEILNNIIINMRSIELKDYRREYIGSVKVTLEK